MASMSSNRFGEVPEWEGEPRELFAVPASDEVLAHDAHAPMSGIDYHLAHVLNDAGVFDPDFLDELNG